MHEVDVVSNSGNAQQNYNLDLEIIDQLDPELIHKNQEITGGRDSKNRKLKTYQAHT